MNPIAYRLSDPNTGFSHVTVCQHHDHYGRYTGTWIVVDHSPDEGDCLLIDRKYQSDVAAIGAAKKILGQNTVVEKL